MIQGSKRVGALQIRKKRSDKTLIKKKKTNAIASDQTTENPSPDQKNKEQHHQKRLKSQLFSFNDSKFEQLNLNVLLDQMLSIKKR